MTGRPGAAKPARGTKEPRAAGAAALLCAAALVASASSADAHPIGLSQGVYALEESRLEARLVFARGDAARLLAGDSGGELSGGLDAARLREAGRAILGGVAVRPAREDGAPCPGELRSAKLVEQDGLEATLAFSCPGPPERLRVEVALLAELPRGHRHLATGSAGARGAEAVLSREAPALELRPSDAPSDVAEDAREQGHAAARPLGLLKLGVEHILTGYDHLVFLFGLILLPARARSLLATVTAFTLGHSVSLALATLGILSPPAAVVEPLIAASVAYVGVENLLLRGRPGGGERRWRLTLPFGFVHGFGFAGVLSEIGLPAGDVPLALAAFNAGVEVGQLAVLALVMPLIYVAQRSPAFRARVVPLLSAGVAVAGAVWLLARLFG